MTEFNDDLVDQMAAVLRDSLVKSGSNLLLKEWWISKANPLEDCVSYDISGDSHFYNQSCQIMLAKGLENADGLLNFIPEPDDELIIAHLKGSYSNQAQRQLISRIMLVSLKWRQTACRLLREGRV